MESGSGEYFMQTRESKARDLEFLGMTSRWRCLSCLGIVLLLFAMSVASRAAEALELTTLAVSGQGTRGLALRSDGTVWTWGTNGYGEMGIGTNVGSPFPERITGLSNVVSIAASYKHTFAVHSNGTASAWGINEAGQLGDSSYTNRSSPVQVYGLTNVLLISGGSRHSAALTQLGQVWSWGTNVDGQLGHGSANVPPSTNRPVLAAGLTNAVSIDCGGWHTLALTGDGRVWSWGWNQFGQLGLGHTNNRDYPVVVPGLTGVVQIAAGYAHSMALLSNGTIFCWGDNSYGQLGQSNTTDSLQPIQVIGITNAAWIAAGRSDTCVALTAKQTLFSWGFNYINSDLVPRIVPSQKPFLRVEPADQFKLAITRDGEVWAWGANHYGQSGNGDTAGSPTFDIGYDNNVPSFSFSPRRMGLALPSYRGRQTAVTGNVAENRANSFVVPLDLQKGVELNRAGSEQYCFGNLQPWIFSTAREPLRHLALAMDSSGVDSFTVENPIMAFGSLAATAPLYTNQAYRFAVYAGGLDESEPDATNVLMISVFERSAVTSSATNVTPINTFYVSIPRRTIASDTNAWGSFFTNGLTSTIETNGLTTTLQFIDGDTNSKPWTLGWMTNSSGSPAVMTNCVLSAYRVTHIARSNHYCYVVSALGKVQTDVSTVTALGTNTSGSWRHLPVYSLDFSERPAWRSRFIDQPQFEGTPVPPVYGGKDQNQLLEGAAALTNQYNLGASTNYLALDQSPELLRHPVLDQFVADMNGDPLALINFVINEVELSDFVSLASATEQVKASVNIGGVNRDALATFLERRGSPLEQCALMLYLLRQSGCSAAYIFPTNGNLQLLDARLSQLWQMQVRGVTWQSNRPWYTNSLIKVNYPWVVTEVGGQTVHIFPWLKDLEIIEGYNLYDYMPTNHSSALEWTRDYLLRKPEIMQVGREGELPGKLFQKYVQSVIATNPASAGISMDDLGVRVRNRRHHFHKFGDLPRPNAIVNSAQLSVVAHLSESTNSFPFLAGLFDRLVVDVYRDTSTPPNKLLTSGEWFACNLHNRKLLLLTNSNTGVKLWMSAYRPNTSGTGSFSGPFAIQEQQLTANYGETPNAIIVQVTHRMHSSTLQEPQSAIPVGESLATTNEVRCLPGSIAAICMRHGRVNREMLRRHAEDYWRMELQVATNSSYAPSVQEYQGTALYMLGMGYYGMIDRSRNELLALHKIKGIGDFAIGLAALRGGASGTNQAILLDMVTERNWLVGNETLHAESGNHTASMYENYKVLSILDGSANEHAAVESIFGSADAASTVKLLHLAQFRATNGNAGVLEMNKRNYSSIGATAHTGYGTTALKELDPTFWQTVTNHFGGWDGEYVRIFITPGIITNRHDSYRGLGALILGADERAALISGNKQILNGAEDTFDSFSDIFNDIHELRFALEELINDLHANLFRFYEMEFADGIMSQRPVFSDTDLARLGRDDVSAAPTAEQSAYADLARTTLNLGGFDDDATFRATGNLGFYGTPDAWFRNMGDSVADPVSATTGEFYIDSVDLDLPGPFPLHLRRNYLSHNPTDNQFGFGWKSSIMPFLQIATNAMITNCIIYAADIDGAVIAFGPISNGLWRAEADLNPTLNNYSITGVGGRANPFGATIVVSATNEAVYILHDKDGSTRTFEMQEFPIYSGTNELRRLRPYLTKWQDDRGNYHIFQYGTNASTADYGQLRRVESANGNLLLFAYDNYGRITEAVSKDGRRVSYDYDGEGDLVKVTLPDASYIAYEYQSYPVTATNAGLISTNFRSTHLITKEIKPDGRVLMNEYDEHHRVTNQWATVGTDLRLVRNATFLYENDFSLTTPPANGVSGTTSVIDVFNNTNRYDYSNGAITNITDALGNVVELYWYDIGESAPAFPKGLWKVKTKRGLWSEFQYDERGNVTNAVSWGDFTGEGATQYVTNRYSFNTNNLPLLLLDAMGRKTTFTYHSNYNRFPSQLTAFVGDVAIRTNQYFYHDAVTVTTNGFLLKTNYAFGLLERAVVASGTTDAATNEWSHDGRGFVTKRIRYPNTADAIVTNWFDFNDRGELIETRDAAGRAVRSAFDGRGNPQWKEVYDENGALMAWDYRYYNENGELTWSDGPRYDPEDYVWRDYDGAGRMTQQIRWRSRAKKDGTGVEAEPGDNLYATSFYEYDAFGNLSRVTDQDGNSLRMTYDAIGQMIGRQRYSATNETPVTIEGFGYEAGGSLSRYTNAMGAITSFFYTTTGRLVRQENPDGTTNRWLYDISGRVQRTYLPNSEAYWETLYDDAKLMITRRFSGDTNYAESMVFDRRGNLVLHTNFAGAVFTNFYDGLNRLKESRGPVTISGISTQQISTVSYDAAGIWTTNINNLGERTVSKSDALDRPVQFGVYTSANQLVRQLTMSFSADHNSVTVTSGTQMPVSMTVATDTLGMPVVKRFADGGFTLSRYDRLENLVSYRDELNQVTEFAYDGLYRLATKTLPDGAKVNYGYDALGNLTNRVMPGGLQWSASYDEMGRRTAEQLSGGGLTNRNYAFTYYPATNTAAGLLQLVSDPRGVTFTNFYDGLRRLTNVTVGGPQTEHSQSTIYYYDRLNRGTNVVRNIAGQPTTQMGRWFDGYGQLTEEVVSIGGTAISDFKQVWNAAGRRTRLQQAGAGTGGTIDYGYRADDLLASVTQGPVGAAFGYDDGGLLNVRTNNWRVWSVTARDYRGRAVTNALSVAGTANVMVETLGWRPNSALHNYAVTRIGSWNESRDYLYDTRGQLTRETFQPNSGVVATNDYGFSTNQLGVLVSMNTTGAVTATWTGTGLDALGRLGAESVNWPSNLTLRSHGMARGADALTVWLGGTVLTNVVTNTQGGWYADMTLGPSNYSLSAEGTYPASVYGTRRATNTFTVESRTGGITNLYDAAGNVTNRLAGSKAQALVWDAAGNLLRVTTTVGGTTSAVWTATYDPLGRRQQTADQATSASAVTSLIQSYYDPQVEFGEIGVSVDGVRTWSVVGPDRSGTYGAFQGIGGLEGEVREDGYTLGALSDHFGNVVASVSGTQVMWSGTRLSGYGPVAGYAAPVLHGQNFISQASPWRSRRADTTGFYCLGARYYDPLSGRFLSCDPYGHGSSMSLYDYASGDPVNNLDPDGRFSRGAVNAAADGINPLYDVGGLLAGGLQATWNPEGAISQYGEQGERALKGAEGLRDALHDAVRVGHWLATGNESEENTLARLRFGGTLRRAFAGPSDETPQHQAGYATFNFLLMGVGAGEGGAAANAGRAASVGRTATSTVKAGWFVSAKSFVKRMLGAEVGSASDGGLRIQVHPRAGELGGVNIHGLNAAKTATQPIALGKSIGLDAFATSQGARTLMKDPNFLNTISSELQAGTKFSVDLSGISGEVGPAIQRAASGRGSPFDLELLEIRNFIKRGGPPQQVDFFLNGTKVGNPF